MKNSFLLISLAALMFLFSCKKDEETSPFDAKYTDETPEQSKLKVEQNAIDLVDQLDVLSSATAIEVLINLNDLGSGMPLKSTKTSPVLEPLSLIRSLGDKGNVSKVFDGLKTTEELMVSNPIAFSALFDSIAGKYTYNPVTDKFVESKLADKIVIEFPGKATDLTNTAVITVDNFSVAEIPDTSSQWPESLDNELPASIRIDLKYYNTSIAGATFNASYKSDGMPTQVVVAIHSPYSSASWRNTLKHEDDILFETYIAAAGNWSAASIAENVTDTAIYIEDIINNANAHLILMNLEIVGKVNVKALGDAMWALDESTTEHSDSTYIQAKVDAINANAQLVVIYRDSNTKIAEAEAYVISYEDFYDNTHYDVAMRFVYADGSKVDADTYINGDETNNSELDNFYVSLNDFIDKLNAEYDLGLNYIGPTK
jgi:hypothetical protein